MRGHRLQRRLLGGDEIQRSLTAYRLDAARAGGDGHLGDNLDDANLARGAHVRAAAEFLGEAADVDEADALAIFVAEERQHVVRLLVVVDLGALHLRVIQHLRVDELLALLDLRVRERLEVGEVKTHPVGRLVRAELADVRAEHFPQSPMNQMRRRVMTVDGAAALKIYVKGGRGVES